MYKVLTQKDALCAMSQQRSLSARSRPKLPQLNSIRTSALQSNFQPHVGYVSIDHLIPYSFVVRLQSIIIKTHDSESQGQEEAAIRDK